MNGKSLTFYELFNQVDFVQIPIIQRDYAQGRVEEEGVRSQFLRTLFDALRCVDTSDRQPLDLDFVYGNYESGDSRIFSVLDGQQRLTTLFLLHWFLAYSEDRIYDFRNHFVSEDGHSKFTYKTRPSTTEFFNALVTADNLDISTLDSRPLSQKIVDCQWFYLSWKQDPTVSSCLCMLDSIELLYKSSSEHIYDRLLQLDAPYITFQFLRLESFGLSDELYIKMNARGKPLTVFENFKAKLEAVIKRFDDPWPQYTLSFKDGWVSGYEYFSHKIDTDWADLFWPFRNVSEGSHTFDTEFMNFIRLVIVFNKLLSFETGSEDENLILTELLGDSGRVKELPTLKYEELGCLNQAFIIRLIRTLDVICGVGEQQNNFVEYLGDNPYYAEYKTFTSVINNTASYDEKLKFFAFYEYLSLYDDLEGLMDWMRVVNNLVQNTTTDSALKFSQGLHALKGILKNPSIYDALKSDIKIPYFTQAQVLEEKIKAHLITRFKHWKNAILKIETHQFFKGQIGCLLHFSGILHYFREHNHCNWGKELNFLNFKDFTKYAFSLTAVMDAIYKSSSDLNFAWERAVLSKGDYFTVASWDRINLLSSRSTKNNIPRDHSWKRVLRIGDRAYERKQLYIKFVLDDPDFDLDNLQGSLELISLKYLQDCPELDWKFYLIKYPQLFALLEQGFMSHNAKETILYGHSQRNHYHYEFYTKVMELSLESSKENLAPFQRSFYSDVKSRDEVAGFLLRDFTYKDATYGLDIKRLNGMFWFMFKKFDDRDFPEEIKEKLYGLEYEDFGGNLTFAIPGEDVQSVNDFLLKTCKRLGELLLV